MRHHTVTATIHGTNGAETVRISVPEEIYSEQTQGHRQIDTGIIRIGHHTGHRWGIVRDYSIWTRRDGTVYGDTYTAYDLYACGGRTAYAKILAEAHYTDTKSGRRLQWRLLLNGHCSRAATNDERRRLKEAGYSEEDAARAWIYAETQNGAKLYFVNGCGWAVEGETGDIIANLDDVEAINQWA